MAFFLEVFLVVEVNDILKSRVRHPHGQHMAADV